MAKADWLNVTPMQGSGDVEVSVSTKSANTGRNARKTVLTWKAANVANITRNVYQAGKPEYVDIEESKAVEKEGKVVTISGISNSAKLTFSLGSGNLDIQLPTTYMANSLTTENGVAIEGDPGSQMEYPFSISITVPSNVTTDVMTRQIIVTDEGGNVDFCELLLAGGDPYVRVAEGEIRLDYLGTAVSVVVESNTVWSIE